jgi:hypothetical protein
MASDDSGAHYKEVLFGGLALEFDRFGSEGGHFCCIFVALGAGAGICITAVYDDTSQTAAGSSRAGEDNGGGDDLIGGVHTCCGARIIGHDEDHILGSCAAFDSSGHSSKTKTLGQVHDEPFSQSRGLVIEAFDQIGDVETAVGMDSIKLMELVG